LSRVLGQYRTSRGSLQEAKAIAQYDLEGGSASHQDQHLSAGLDITLPDTALCCRRFGALSVPRIGENMASSVWSGYL